MVKYIQMKTAKDRIEPWLQVVLSITALVLSGGSASVLVLFQEHLPRPLYLTLLWVLCLFIIAILLRLAFGDLIESFRIWIRRRLAHRKRCKLVENWRTKWLEMANLVNTAMHSKRKPTDDQEIRYRVLRFWFIKHRTQLILIWQHFNHVRTQQAHENDYDQYSAQHNVFHDHRYDPFSCFYEPLSLGILKAWMIETEHWSDTDTWLILTKLKELTNEFVEWIKIN